MVKVWPAPTGWQASLKPGFLTDFRREAPQKPANGIQPM
jgi:hypothetical protein